MRSVPCLSAVALLGLATAAHAGNDPDLVVMTQNQYLGADLAPLAAAPDAASFNAELVQVLQTIAAANTPERVDALAAQIVDRSPHLVSVQEVFAFTCTDLAPVPEGYGCTDPSIAGAFNDHLDETLDSLGAQGGAYYVAGSVTNLDTSTVNVIGIPGIPFEINGVPALLNVIDRDVVLARADVAAQATPIPCARPSADGCNYQAVAEATTPAGPIAFERGFVIVDGFNGSDPFRFVATHLETRNPDPTNPLSAAIQAFQAQELLATLDAVPTYPGAELIVAGDFNSDPADPVLPTPFGPLVPPYLQLAFGGYSDTWLFRPGNPVGNTCCQAEDLRNETSAAYERIDLVWTRNAPSSVKANVLGYDDADKTASGLWPSDHGSVVTEITW